MFQLLRPLVQAIQPWLVPFCFFSAWTIVGLLGWSVWTATRDTIARSRQMHRIPCARCQFFTSDYHLKCTVRPSTALTEEAISCPDYEPCASIYPANRQTLS
ncbi:hypothetical protein [Stenomitos frigidus]|uniref:Uncharacterized protein n=1 Tax=Stenomitos frigidus ULC18 TaxID=2107698 RepID=A0A2T1EHT4_9CYAN|nr:hypothetical protein [Stenomitos frigidus]PSB32316.1 hypothetical protein C7B82_05750 [Stenomitos frigidus ULC18]